MSGKKNRLGVSFEEAGLCCYTVIERLGGEEKDGCWGLGQVWGVVLIHF